MPSPHTAAAHSPTFIAPSLNYYAATTSSPSARPDTSRTAASGPTASSRGPYYPPSNNLDYHTETTHIAAAALRPSQPFSASSLPRTSSLLPPPRLDPNPTTPPAAVRDDPFNAPPTALPSAFTDPLNDVDTSPKNIGRRRQSRTHSRSSSLGGLSDSFRNLNRWSASTTSSRASNTAYQKQSNTSSRRMSVDSTALQGLSSNINTSPSYNSPRRLQKSRPSTSGEAPRFGAPVTRARQPSPSRVKPFQSLPPIVTLPSLEQEVRSESPAVSARPENQRIPYFRRPSVDTTGYFWDEFGTTPVEGSQYSSRIDTPDSALPTSYFNGSSVMTYTESDNFRERGHSRNRSQVAKGSTDSTSSQKSRGKQPSQKAMLSKALQKANTAVQLDNAQNFEGARDAYSEACGLLHQVLLRTAGEEDRKKLEAIRKTYNSRIEELDQLLPAEAEESKALPQRPQSNSTGSTFKLNDDSQEVAIIETATATRIYPDADRARQTPVSYSMPTSAARRQIASKPGEALTKEPAGQAGPMNLTSQYSLQSSFSKEPSRGDRVLENEILLPRSLDNQYMPPPLSPRKPISPIRPPERASPDVAVRNDSAAQGSGLAPDERQSRGHIRGNSHESTSWLDPIDESGGSTVSSVHSRTSSMHIRRKHIRGLSGNTEAEFDAALDDAIEAAYDDGYEPMDSPATSTRYGDDGDDIVAKALRKVELAKERVRQSEREVQRLTEEREKRQLEALKEDQRKNSEGFYDGNSSDDEERMLEEMTRGYAIEEFAFGKQKKPSVPRASDSSELTSRTWHSSLASNPPTSTPLSTVSENTAVPTLSKGQAPMAPPPTQSLPKLPPQRPGSSSGGAGAANSKAESVRDRRLSGQKPKELKIETTKLSPAPTIVPQPATAGPTMSSSNRSSSQPKAAGFIVQQRQALSAGPNRTGNTMKVPSPATGTSPGDTSPPTPPLPQGFVNNADARSRSPSVPRPGLRKNFSSSSLKSLKSRNLSISNIDEVSDLSPGTPSSNQFGMVSSAARLPAMPSLPTPIAVAFKERMNAGSAAGGLYLFDSDIHSPSSPGAPNPLLAGDDAPAPLEPCPTEVMLRPFWLMRALYQTLAHPRGGYLSNKLFVPRDAWRVKGVKLRNVEDKIAQCDLLTAALQKLARADTCDADAVLEEMQSLEGVLEQVQSFLSRRLGNEVGVHAAAAMFKEADVGAIDGISGGPGASSSVASGSGSAVPRSGSVSGKTGAFSWRRLRSKNSSAGMSTAYERGAGSRTTSGVSAGDGPRESTTAPSLPMTSHPTSKPSKRDVGSVQFSGPYANYMAALARLFDAAQSIDQIARQVEDPGLRHADKTQVGLELCTRHAAEFFGFYVCRFVLADLTMLLDKFIKRGSEWVLA